MEKIGIEEHWDFSSSDREYQVDERLKDMDRAGIDMQVLSSGLPANNPRNNPLEAASLAIDINNRLSKLIEKHPKRFSSFAVVSPHNADLAARELERAVKELGFKGTMLSHGVDGEFLDEPKYLVLLEMAEKLDVPIYLHPTAPPPDMIKPFLTYPGLRGPMFGFSVQAGLHAMRLICSGIFDKFPNLKIILGHMGEGIPYWLSRIDNRLLWQKARKIPSESNSVTFSLKRTPSQYFKENFYITTSGVFWYPPLQCALSSIGADRILLAVDYPAESIDEATNFIESVPISDSDREKICHLNAEKLLRL